MNKDGKTSLIQILGDRFGSDRFGYIVDVKTENHLLGSTMQQESLL